MTQPNLFNIPAAVSLGARGFNPKPTPAGHRRMMARCTVEKCKFCKAFDLPLSQYRDNYSGALRWDIDRNALMHARAQTACPEHKTSWIKFAPIEGTHSEAHKCDPRCTSAIGRICVCQCGGANHGCGWL